MNYIDQIGRTVELGETPKRIISLVPSQTELLHHLGLGDRVVGITKFCTHPDIWHRSKPRIGGTKNIHFQKVHDLNPELIIANKEENNKADILELEKHYLVWISDVNDLNSSFEMIQSIGEITSTQETAGDLLRKLQRDFDTLEKGLIDKNSESKKIVYLIWFDPLMSAGKGTFIDQMISAAGFENLVTAERYPELSIEELKALHPDALFLSSEPFPFKEKHLKSLSMELGMNSNRLHFVDGRMFSWYGSALLEAQKYFTELNRQLNKSE